MLLVAGFLTSFKITLWRNLLILQWGKRFLYPLATILNTHGLWKIWCKHFTPIQKLDCASTSLHYLMLHLVRVDLLRGECAVGWHSCFSCYMGCWENVNCYATYSDIVDTIWLAWNHGQGQCIILMTPQRVTTCNILGNLALFNASREWPELAEAISRAIFQFWKTSALLFTLVWTSGWFCV